MIRFPELWKARGSDYTERPYILAGQPVWQQCYICGRPVTFAKEQGRYIRVDYAIRHKRCEPPPLR